MLTLLLKFFASPASKIGLPIMAGLVVMFLAGGFYLSWKRSVEKAALANQVQQQMERVITDLNRQLEISRELAKVAEAATLKLQKQQEEWDAERRELDKMISEMEKDGMDRESSQILKDTVRKLGGQS